MANAKHTPGEFVALPPGKPGKRWRVAAKGRLGGGSMAAAEVTWIVATIGNGAPGDTLETEGANARLFAASPDLLRELVDFHDHTIDMGWHECDGIPGGCPVAAAIAKAEGR